MVNIKLIYLHSKTISQVIHPEKSIILEVFLFNPKEIWTKLISLSGSNDFSESLHMSMAARLYDQMKTHTLGTLRVIAYRVAYSHLKH